MLYNLLRCIDASLVVGDLLDYVLKRPPVLKPLIILRVESKNANSDIKTFLIIRQVIITNYRLITKMNEYTFTNISNIRVLRFTTVQK